MFRHRPGARLRDRDGRRHRSWPELYSPGGTTARMGSRADEVESDNIESREWTSRPYERVCDALHKDRTLRGARRIPGVHHSPSICNFGSKIHGRTRHGHFCRASTSGDGRRYGRAHPQGDGNVARPDSRGRPFIPQTQRRASSFQSERSPLGSSHYPQGRSPDGRQRSLRAVRTRPYSTGPSIPSTIWTVVDKRSPFYDSVRPFPDDHRQLLLDGRPAS